MLASSSSAPSPLAMNIDSDTSSAPRFPVPHKNFSLEIKGNKTEISISRYEDHFLVSPGGTLHLCFYGGRFYLFDYLSGYCYSNRNHGDNTACQPMLVACARQLIEHTSLSGTSKSLVLSLGLKDHSTETLKGIVSAVINNCPW